MSSEAAIQQAIRLDIARSGIDLWRQNVGACQDQSGRLIRYGLLNDSKAINEKFKSSDLIGIRPVLITSEWVGHTVGVFAAIECKESGWKLRPGDARGQAQQRFIDLVRAAGGMAGFARSVDEARAVLMLPALGDG
jgi:hypothetical protein